MAQDSTLILNIGQMIDLAIGTPETGVVDFEMVHTVLHLFAQQLKVLEKNVEFRYSGPFLPEGIPETTKVAVNEFVIETDQSVPADAKKKKKGALVSSPAVPAPETLLVVEKLKKGEKPTKPTDTVTIPAKPPEPVGAPGTPEVASPKRLPSIEKLSLVTLSKFNVLEDTVEDLKQRVYGSIPKNEDIIKEVRSQTNIKAITDMWTSLNVSTRLEAAEEGIGKLSSLIEDLLAEAAERETAKPGSKHSIAVVATGVEPASQEDMSAVKQQLDSLRGDLENLTNSFYTAMADMQAGLETTRTTQPEPPKAEPPQQIIEPSRTPRPSFSALTSNINERLNSIEKRLKECCDSIGKSDKGTQGQISGIQEQIEYLMKQVAVMGQSFEAGKMSPDLAKDLQGLMKLFETVQNMQVQLKQVHDTAMQLANEKQERKEYMDALIEQIELLKTIKMDREDMAEAMADKADLRMLARKVSHDQFEIACDDLSKGLEHALGKLNTQESLWQQALDDIQREIEMKLDKMELSPVKDFFNTKLRQLQDNLKKIAALRKQSEAAGTKRRLLHDVNCISCDADVVMPTEAASTLPVLKPLPPHLSMKPYLSYELDAIRKTQAANLPQRNLHDWEHIEKQAHKPQQRPLSENDKHLCNRYCGGSHTVTTAAQRVARLGHFMKQWGPDVVPLTSTLAAGDDGRLYKVSAPEGDRLGPGPSAADTICTPKPVKKVEPPKTKVAISAPECKCLESGGTAPK